MTDPVSTEELRAARERMLTLVSSPGAEPMGGWTREVDDLIYAAQLAALSDPRPDSGIDVERLARAEARYNEANHTPEDAEEHWRSYRRHAEGVAAQYARLSTPRTETSEP